jgi:hypothetical protein
MVKAMMTASINAGGNSQEVNGKYIQVMTPVEGLILSAPDQTRISW